MSTEIDVTADELVARAAAMRATLRSRQAQCEAEGRLPDETNREMVEAGFFRVLQPRRFDGYELGLEAFLRIAVELSRGCPSSGWVYALTAGHAHTVTMWPEQGQVELFGDGDFRGPLSNLPARAVAVDGAIGSTAGGTTARAATRPLTSSAGSQSPAPTAGRRPTPAGRPSRASA
jgi:3-hydroxy-9,10-secoandrosta-1,3,5(10)-triene-9,17-dione monooxygenase